MSERPESEWKWVAVPPIVDEATWRDANRQLTRNTKYNHREPKRYGPDQVLLYGGHVRCDYCGHAMQAMQHLEHLNPTSSKERAWYCVCYAKARTAEGRCPGKPSILARRVDSFVWRTACEIIRNPSYMRGVVEQTDQEWPLDAEIAYREREIAKLDAEDARTGAEVLGWGGDPDYEPLRILAREAIKHNAEMRRGHVAKRDALLAKQERRAAREQRLAEFSARAKAQAGTLDDLTPEQRRRILLDLQTKVYVRRSGDTYVLHDPILGDLVRNRDRVSVHFSLSDEAAANVSEPNEEGDIWYTASYREANGDLWSVSAANTWPPREVSDDPIDLSNVRPPEADGDLTEVACDVLSSDQPPDAPSAGDSPENNPSSTPRGAGSSSSTSRWGWWRW